MSNESTVEIAQAAARAAVNEFVYGPAFREVLDAHVNARLEALGIDTKDAEATRRDLVKLREWNEFWTFVSRKGVGSTITWLVTGALASVAIGLGIIIGRQ